MSETLSLKELKEQNAAADAAKQPKPESKPKERLVDDYVEEVEEVVADKVEESEVEDDHDESTELESWMQTDEATSENEKKGFKPNPEAAKQRKKAQALRGSLAEKDDELEQLRAEIDKLKQSPSRNAQPESLSPRPKLADYDYDDEKYDAAIDEWFDKKLEHKITATTSIKSKQQEAKQQEETLKRDIQDALDSHYSRATKLVESGKVSAELYQQADKSVRQLVESVFPKQGEATTDALIKTLNSLGEGSEKVIYSLGVNQGKRDKFETLLRKDAFAAIAYLGSLQTELNSPNKQKSSAPKPAAQLQGNAGNAGKPSVMQKQYTKSSDIQERLDLKRQAKKQGIDTSKW